MFDGVLFFKSMLLFDKAEWKSRDIGLEKLTQVKQILKSQSKFLQTKTIIFYVKLKWKFVTLNQINVVLQFCIHPCNDAIMMIKLSGNQPSWLFFSLFQIPLF